MWRKFFVAVIGGVLTGSVAAPTGAQGPDHARAAPPEASGPAASPPSSAGGIVKNSYIVTFRDRAGPPSQVANELAQQLPFQLGHVYEHAVAGMAITIPEHAAIHVLDALRRNPNVESIGNDLRGTANAQSLPKGIDRVNAEPSMSPSPGDGLRLAVIDTGVDLDHADLVAGLDTSLSVDCVNYSGCGAGGDDDNGHGTFVAGVAGARDNDASVIGASPATSLLSVKSAKSDGSVAASDFIAGLDYVAQLNQSGQHVDVVNASIAFNCSVCTDDSTNSTVIAMHDSVRAIVSGGTTMVVAAGNQGSDTSTTVPAAFDEVITVSALDDGDGEPGNDSFAWFSNYGEDIDLIAPGVGELSLKRGGGTTRGSGTSYASPHVAGVAAVFIRTYLAETGTKPSPGTVRQALIEAGECASGALHGALGCDTVWSGDPDGIGEPLVRADNFSTPTSTEESDLAVTAVSTPSPAMSGETQAVDVGVANEGDFQESVSVTLTENGTEIASPVSVSLDPGTSTTVTFDWTPLSTGERTLTGSVDVVTGESDTSDNSRSIAVTVEESTVHDVAIAGVTVPADATVGDSVEVAVDVQNVGTADESLTVAVTDTPLDGSNAGSLSSSQDLTLTAGGAATLTFTWDTTNASTGDHELTAEVTLTSATDADTSNNTGSATSTLAAAQDEQTFSDVLYVADMALSQRSRGKGGAKNDLMGDVAVQWDSDGDGVAEGSDRKVKEASVDILVTHDSNGGGTFDCATDTCWSVQASTNGQGEASFQLKGVPAGSYQVSVTGISASGLTYDPTLDQDNPSLFAVR